MNSKLTALPLILALAAGGCSNTPQYYPNFKACYKDTGDANECLQYIDENNPDLRTSNSSEKQYTTGTSQEDDFDGNSALTGAAVGAVAGYALSNASNSKNRRKNGTYIVPPSNETSRTKRSALAPSKTSPKPTTVRSGFGSTISKSFGG